ncbi:hypothetical protein BGW80DRAFT_1559584 [Lactifluus volemus]|nr:hypothetical protein BGW80DRAFT_1559584 [Lactifluus volemus]
MNAPHNQAYLSPARPPARPPAHKHAHHLHSIPPREKSPLTLIIDHLLWAHARTHFAQTRAELAMRDRTGELAGSDHPRDEEESRIARQDSPFARRLTQRAEELEKVVVGMLEQPPRDCPFPGDEPITPVTSPQQRPPVGPSSVGKHVLPNGVPLRLALTTVINDMFVCESPSHRLSHVHAVAAATSSSSKSRRNSGASTSRLMNQTSSPSSTPSPSPSPLSRLPKSLVPLLFVYSAATIANSTPFPFSPSNLTYPSLRHQPFNTEPTPRACDMFTAGVDYELSCW